MEEPARRSQDGFFFDAFNDTEPMIWVDDLVANLECHMALVRKVCMGAVS
jgi:hypothetical protein